MNDAFGRVVKKDDVIVYACRQGSSLWLVKAVVKLIENVGQNEQLIVSVVAGFPALSPCRMRRLARPTFVVLERGASAENFVEMFSDDVVSR